jgi:heat shock protein HslJ
MSYARTTHRVLFASSAAAIAASLAIVLPGTASTDRAQARGDALFGKAWVAKSVVKNGERTKLVKGTRLVLRLRHHGKEDRARWDAGCNEFGARVKVKGERLRFGGVAGTAIGCGPALHRQDNWIARFLDSNPRWKRKAGKLILRRGDDVIRLRRR